jgi:hypothetical protein
MGTLHIAPGDSAGGSLHQALRAAGRSESVLRFRDDLSCGPIDSEDPSARAKWWSRFYDVPEVESDLETFWSRIAATDDRLVVWFSRHAASELSFFLAFADRLGERPYDIVDVTGTQWPVSLPDGSTGLTRPAVATSIIPEDRLKTLLGRERPVTVQERGEARRQWRQLQRENAPFRVVTPAGLVSAPLDHFDSGLIKRASQEWRKIALVVHEVLGDNSEPYYQVGDLMLLARIVALVEEGELLADGDPWGMRACRVRLPGTL